jgi:hypothetical protein
MANSYLNMLTFVLCTIAYYLVIKPKITYTQFIDPDEYKKYTKNSYSYLGIYLLLVMVIQFIVNAMSISATCGGSISQNLGAAALYTFLPWTLMFGVLLIVLTMYPGFKSAFADVVGYFFISSSANKVLTELLIDKNVQQKIDGNQQASAEQKKYMEDAADAIIKICGNTSILINQIVPSNFKEYWEILKPLMKSRYQNNSEETLEQQNKLFELVMTRDNIGEAMWYFYTGILLSSIVQLNIATRGCINNSATMEANYQAYLNQENQAQQQQQQATSQVYTITN